MADEALLGMDGGLYVNDGGDYGTPNWREITNVKDAAQSGAAGEADVSTRGTGIFRATITTLLEGDVTFGMVDDGGEDIGIFEEAWATRSVLDMMYLNRKRDIVGARGWRMPMQCREFASTQNLEEGQMRNVTLKITKSSNPPTRIVIT